MLTIIFSSAHVVKFIALWTFNFGPFYLNYQPHNIFNFCVDYLGIVLYLDLPYDMVRSLTFLNSMNSLYFPEKEENNVT